MLAVTNLDLDAHPSLNDILKPPIPISQYFVGNSPLSRLDSPTASPQPIFNQPTLTPNLPNHPFDGAAVGDRAVTLRNVLNFGNEEKEETVQERGTCE